MHNFETNFDKIRDKIKPFAPNMVDQAGNAPRPVHSHRSHCRRDHRQINNDRVTIPI